MDHESESSILLLKLLGLVFPVALLSNYSILVAANFLNRLKYFNDRVWIGFALETISQNWEFLSISLASFIMSFRFKVLSAIIFNPFRLWGIWTWLRNWVIFHFFEELWLLWWISFRIRRLLNSKSALLSTDMFLTFIIFKPRESIIHYLLGLFVTNNIS